MKPERYSTYSHKEETINWCTHAAGLAMGLAVCMFFLIKCTAAGTPLAGLAFGLYLFGVVSSYLTSVIYHAVPSARVKAKATARKFDHAAIFLHIAGSYSPLTLIGMRNGGEPVWAWVIFGIVWISATVGTLLSFRKMKAHSRLETACYVLMGLTILIAFKPFYESCGLEIVLWVIGEGIAYITGAVLYSFKKIPYIHSVFHLFVILGDVCHMVATWKMIEAFVL